MNRTAELIIAFVAVAAVTAVVFYGEGYRHVLPLPIQATGNEVYFAGILYYGTYDLNGLYWIKPTAIYQDPGNTNLQVWLNNAATVLNSRGGYVDPAINWNGQTQYNVVVYGVWNDSMYLPPHGEVEINGINYFVKVA